MGEEKKNKVEVDNTEKTTNKVKTVGLVLSGGGGKGAYQAGVLKALYYAGVLKDVTAISGASIGAVNAMLYAMGDISLLEKCWMDIDMDVVFDIDMAMIKENRLAFSRNAMDKLFDKFIDQKVIKDSPYDIYFSLTDVTDGSQKGEYVKVDGESLENMKTYLMASTALPVIYEPVKINEKSYKDGGLTDNNPVTPLYEQGIRKFIMIRLSYGTTFDTSKFPDAEFIIINPSHDLGSLISGTLNFIDSEKELKFILGIKDGERAIKTKFEKDPIYIEMERTLAESDYKLLIDSYNQQKKMDALSKSVSDNLDIFNKIADKYKDI